MLIMTYDFLERMTSKMILSWIYLIYSLVLFKEATSLIQTTTEATSTITAIPKATLLSRAVQITLLSTSSAKGIATPSSDKSPSTVTTATLLSTNATETTTSIESNTTSLTNTTSLSNETSLYNETSLSNGTSLSNETLSNETSLLSTALPGPTTPGAIYETLNDPQTEVVILGNDITLKCMCDNCTYVYWKKKKEQFFIVEEGDIMEEFRDKFQLVTNATNGTYNLVIKDAVFNSSGTYFCARSMVGVSQEYTGIGADVIVVDSNVTCKLNNDTLPHLKVSQMNTYLVYEDEAVINCSVKYSTSESCEAIPLWHDLATDKNLSSTDKEVTFDIEDGHAWLIIKANAQPQNATQFNLSIAFKCRNSKNIISEHMPIFETGFMSPMILMTGEKNEVTTQAVTVIKKKAGTDTVILTALAVILSVGILVSAIFLAKSRRTKNYKKSVAYQRVMDRGYLTPTNYAIPQPVDNQSPQEKDMNDPSSINNGIPPYLDLVYDNGAPTGARFSTYDYILEPEETYDQINESSMIQDQITV